MQAGLPRFLRKFPALRKADPVRRDMQPLEAKAAGVADCIQENRGDGGLTPSEKDVDLAPWPKRQRSVKYALDVRKLQFVHVAHVIGIHEARVAFHVAAVCQIDQHEKPSPVLDA